MTAVITAKVTLDGSAVTSVVAQINGQIGQIGSAAEKSVGQATRAVEGHGEAWKGAGEKITDVLKDIAAAAGIAFSIDKIAEWTKQAIEGAEQIEKLSQTLGVSTQTLQTFNYAAGLTGTSIDAVSGSLTRLERAQVEARDGSVQTVEAFRAIGISATNASGQLKPADQLIIEVSEHLSRMQDGASKTAVVLQLMGRGAADSIPFLNSLGKEYQNLYNQAVALGLVLSEGQQKQLVQTQEAMNELGQVVKGTANQFAIALGPAIKEVADDLGHLLQAAELSGMFQQIGAGVKFVADNLGILLNIFKAFFELKVAQWFIGAIGSMAALSKEAIIGASVWAELTGGVAAAGVAMGVVEGIAGGLLSLVGGIPGVIALAAVGVYELATAEDSAQKATVSLKEAQDLLNHTTEDSVVHDLAAAEAVKKKAAAEIADTQALLANLEAQKQAASGTAGGVGGAMMKDMAAIQYDALEHNIDGVKQHLKEAQAALDGLNSSTQAGQSDMKAFNLVVEDTSKAFVAGDIKGNTAKLAAAEKQILDSGDKMIAQGQNKTIVNALEDKSIDELASVMEKANKTQINYNSNKEASTKIAQEQQKDLAAYEQALDALTGKLEGPYVQAQEQYNIAVSKAHEQYLKDIQDHVNASVAIEREATLSEKAAQVRDKEIAQLKDQHNIMAQVAIDLNNQLLVMQVQPQYQQALTDGLKEYDTLMKSHFDFYGKYYDDETKLKQALDEQLPIYIAQKQAINDLSAAQKAQEQIQKEWQGIVSSGFDSLGSTIATFITNGLHGWHDFMQGLLSTAKQFIAQIIQEFLKLEVFNGIMNSLFGLSGSSALPTGLGNGILGQAFGGGGGVAGIAGKFFGGGTSAVGTDPDFMPGGALFGTDGNAAGQSLSNLNSAGSTGNGLMGWLFGSSNSQSLLDGGVGSSLGDFTGPGTQYLNYGGGFNVTGEATAGVDQSFNAAGDYGLGDSGFGLGQTLSVAGAVLAGYNEWKASGGGVGGAAGAAAYGTAAYVGGAAISAGIGAAAVGGLGAGVTAGLAAIGPIGWVALAAVAVNMISGGKLFGTAATKFVNASQTETVGANGASVSASETLKGQKAFFGGSYTKTKSLAVDPTVQSAADDFFTALVNDKSAFATSVGQVAGAIIGGTFTQNFDKKGKPTTTSTTINGQTYTNETQAQYGERLEAANFSDVLTHMGINVDTFTKGVQGDADKLFAAVQDVGVTTQQAVIDGKRGLSLFTGSVSDVVNEVIKLNDGSSTLAQTYSDLQVGVSLLRNDIQLAGDTTDTTTASFVEFTSAAEKAAGGAQALSKLIQKFDSIFYNSGQQAQINVNQLRKTTGTELTALGENPDESLKQFKADFDAIRDTLTPDQLVAWYQAGVDLGALNDAIQGIGASMQKYADFEVQTQGDAFVQAFAKAIEAESQQIDTANQLAEAAGKAGASQKDLATAVNVGTVAIGQAIAQLTQGINNDINTLFAVNTSSIDPNSTAGYAFAIQNAKTTADAQDKQQKAQQAGAAFDLIQKLGDFAFASGGSIADVLKGFGLSANEIGQKVGETGDQVTAQIQAEEDNAKSLTTMAAQGAQQIGLLTDMLEVLQGKATTYDISQLGAPVSTADGTKKVGARTATLPSKGTAVPGAPIPAGTSPVGSNGPGASSPTDPVLNKTINDGNKGTQDRLDTISTQLSTLNNNFTRFGLGRSTSQR